MLHTTFNKIVAALEDTHIHAPIAKGASAVAAAGVGISWNELAAMAAFAYTCMLSAEWLWKKVFIRLWLAWRTRRAQRQE